MKFAVYVVSTAGETLCEMAPVSLQLLHTYCVPVVPACGVVVAIVWLDPEIHVNVCAEVYGVPSTVNDHPVGLVCTVACTVGENAAASVIGAFIVTLLGLVVPVYEPVPVPVHPVNA